MCGCCGDCDACTVVCVACVWSVRVRGCGWGRGLGQGSGAVRWCYVCVRCESVFSV